MTTLALAPPSFLRAIHENPLLTTG